MMTSDHGMATEIWWKRSCDQKKLVVELKANVNEAFGPENWSYY